ncbi:MAG: hypothetical protein ACI8PZ_001408 [Myxococcota bacterium]
MDGDTLVYTLDTPLTIGEHTLEITARSPDRLAAGSDSIQVVVAPDTAPTASLLDLKNGALHTDDLALVVQASVTDTDTPLADLRITWLVDRHAVGSSTPEPGGRVTLELPPLAPALHLVAAEVRDGSGLTALDEDFVRVVAADADADGARNPVLGGDDCDDDNAAVHPGAPELCNGVDDDCDGRIDDDDPNRVRTAETTWWADADGDGYGADEVLWGCVSPGPDWTRQQGDCDDRDAAVHPEAQEVCDPAGVVDEDCDGWVDDADPSVAGADLRQWPDDDADGFGDAAHRGIVRCHAQDGWVAEASDCDDTFAGVHPEAVEVCNDRDDDCDGLVDDDDPSLTDPDALWAGYRDVDGDGWGAWTDGVCDPSVLIDVPGDCDDHNADISPDAEELCSNHIDDDCSGDDLGCRYDGLHEVEGPGLGVGGQTVLRGDPGDHLGESLVTGLDADGRPVIMAGAPGYQTNDGAVLVYRGELGVGVDLRGHADASVRILGLERNAQVGTAVALGDLTGDGVPGFAVGAPEALQVDGAARVGAVYLFDGSEVLDGDTWTVDAAHQALGGVIPAGGAGTALAIGDFDCDGSADLAIGAPGDGGGSPGHVYLFRGPLDPAAVSLGDADLIIEGEEGGDRIGNSIAALGDGTGVFPECDDLAVGGERRGDQNNRGVAYRFTHSDIGDAPGGAVYLAGRAHLLVQAMQRSYLGASVAAAGDVDGDGLSELAFAQSEGELDAGSGLVQLVYGTGAMFDDPVSSVADASFVADRLDAVGDALAPVPDLNADGYPEMALGAGMATDELGTPGSHHGAVYVLFGSGR